MTNPLDRLKSALADRYSIEQELGHGGMAVVYLAEDVKHDRKVAVKVFLPELAAALGTDRFFREIKITANLGHPHILPLLDSGEADGLLYYVMPLVEGDSLRNRLNRDKQLAVDEALRITSQVASALSYAHAQNIVHRDIKPENILFQAGEVVVADFGIALAVDSAGGTRLTETGFSLGTPAYMSPEQVSGEQAIDGRSDIYALACVLYEMLAGDPPFVASNPRAVLAKHMTDPAPPITTVRSGVSHPVASALTKALSKAPVDRFESAKAFSEALFATAVETEEQKKSIVVLPFDNLSPDPDNAFFADGLTEELIADLSKVEGLKIISRTSATLAKESKKDLPTIGRELKVRYVLEGSVRRAGNSLRITAQLIEAASDEHLWAEKYAGTLDDVFDLQESLARRIAEALHIALSPAEKQRLASRPIQDVRAYDAFLLARHEIFKFTKQGIDRAFELINGALNTIGDSALLHATLAYGCWAAYDFGIYHDEETLARAERSAERALELDSNLAQAHYAFGLTQYKRGDMQGFLRRTKRAVELEPMSDALMFLGWGLGEVGKLKDGKRYADEALSRDPLFFLAVLGRAWFDMYAGLFDTAVERMRDGRERLAPGDAFSGWWLAQTLAYAGQEEEAGSISEQVAVMEEGLASDLCALLHRAIENDREGVLRVLADTSLRRVAKTDEVYPMCIANALTRVRETEEALDWVEQAVSWGFTNYQFLSQHNHFLAPLRGNERFQQLMELARQKQEAFEI